jgi:hypothetical protein
MTKIPTNKTIREFLGHNGCECRVRIGRDGIVHRYGAPTPTDRSKDFWTIVGTRAEVAREMWSLRAAEKRQAELANTWGPEAWALKGKTIEQAGGELKRHGYRVAHNQLTGEPIVGQKMFGGTTVHGFHKETGPYTSGHSVFLHSTNGTHVNHVEMSGPHHD